MTLTEAIQRRRAVRDFADKQVEESTIRALLSAAVQAPSAMNVQPWTFAIVQNTGLLKRYSDRAKQLLLRATEEDAKAQSYRELLENEAFNIFHNAGTLVAIGALEVGLYTAADCWLAAENLMLAATDAGLGTCCIGFAVPLLNTLDVKAELGFGAAGEVFAPIVIGHPASPVPPVPRQEPRVVSWIR
jgi:nitroreductase